MKCSFAKISTKEAITPVWPFGTDIYGRFLYLESGAERVLIAAFDFCGTYPHEADRWRREMASRTGIPAKSIWYHELQIHAGPVNEAIAGEAMDKLIDISATAVNNMIPLAVECDCFAAECDMGTEFSFNREQYVEGLGGVTVWRGIKFDENGTPFTQDPSIMLLRGYNPNLPVFDNPIYFDNTTDQMAYLFMFKNKKGETLGTVSRFAAHPDVAVLFEHSENPNRGSEYHYDFDWPGYLSEDMEKEYGGISMYINGPCADLATKKDCVDKGTYETSANECKRLANVIGTRIRALFAKNAVKLDTSAVFKTETFEITLPMNEDIPYTHAEVLKLHERAAEKQVELDNAIAANAHPADIKRLIDDRWRLGHLPYILRNGEYGFTDKEFAEHKVTVTIPALRFGGYLFVGVPGESLVDTTVWMRSRFTGTKTVPIDQVNGYYNYMATPRSLTLGGYTYWASWVSRDAIPKLKKDLAPLLDKFLKD